MVTRQRSSRHQPVRLRNMQPTSHQAEIRNPPEMLTTEELQLRILEEKFQRKKKEIVRKIQNLKTLYIQLKKVYNCEKKQITSAQSSIGYPPILSGTFLFPAPIRKRPSVKVHTSTMKQTIEAKLHQHTQTSPQVITLLKFK